MRCGEKQWERMVSSHTRGSLTEMDGANQLGDVNCIHCVSTDALSSWRQCKLTDEPGIVTATMLMSVSIVKKTLEMHLDE